MNDVTYAGIDPGFAGAIVTIGPDDSLSAWDMPVKRIGTGDGYNTLDEDRLIEIFDGIISAGPVKFAVENVQSRPDNAPQNAFQFGWQAGVLFMTLRVLTGNKPKLIAASAWCRKLGQVGKQWNNSIDERFRYLTEKYPSQIGLFSGARGGKLSGRIDAALIAECYRIETRPIMTARGPVRLGKFSGRRPPRFFGAPTPNQTGGLFG